MQINEIREQIAEIISTDMEIWNDVLNNTSPGNYGCDDWKASIDFQDIFVHVPNRTFTVKQVNFSADLLMGASKGDSSFNQLYTEPFSATVNLNLKLLIN